MHVKEFNAFGTPGKFPLVLKHRNIPIPSDYHRLTGDDLALLNRGPDIYAVEGGVVTHFDAHRSGQGWKEILGREKLLAFAAWLDLALFTTPSRRGSLALAFLDWRRCG